MTETEHVGPDGGGFDANSRPVPETLFHLTTADAAMNILAAGFRDGTGKYLTESSFTGVWLSDRPLDASDGVVEGETLLKVSFGESLDLLREYEWVQEIPDADPPLPVGAFTRYREWLVPAEMINRLAIVTLATDDDREVQ